jgi:hypothetical protein
MKIEAEWAKFRANGANATFMLRDEPETPWQINFFLMIQKNIEVSLVCSSSFCLSVLCRFRLCFAHFVRQTSSSRIIVRIDNITSTQLRSQLSAAVAPQRAHDAARGGDV